MKSSLTGTRVELRDHHPSQWRLIADILRGLAEEPKRLSPMYLYDEIGSRLFERICELPEYYLTRAETDILRSNGAAIAQAVGDGVMLVELGSGASIKTRLLLDRLPDLAAYVPVDISRNHLLAAARAISAAYPTLEVLPVCGDFTRPFTLPDSRTPKSRVTIFFPGSTIGNFDRTEAVALLRVMRSIAGHAGGLIIGVDLTNDPQILEHAYDDAAGITAAFNLNVLRRLNREFGASFRVDQFRHRAVWVAAESRIEMHLVSRREQTARIADHAIEFRRDELLVTEHCHKYSQNSFEALAREAGWRVANTWTHPQHAFSVQHLV